MSQLRWVLIEAGSTQEFIFQSNRQRFNVGASALVAEFEDWVKASLEQVPEVKPVVVQSGTAALLVEDVASGAELVRHVTTKALQEAPGLDVWGYVEPEEVDATRSLMERLPEAREGLARTRATRLSPRLRHPFTPFFDACAITGLPAVRTRRVLGDEQVPVSATADAALSRASATHGSWKSLLKDAVVEDLDEDLADAGWVAVIHADGNGIGRLIDTIRTPERYSTFSTALRQATVESLVLATQAIGAEHWMLPILVGGDDVTVICRADQAVPFVGAYLRAFESKTDFAGVLTDSPGPLTASAGIAFVKPHYPFSEAHALSQALTRAAKNACAEQKVEARSSWDFHVLHDSLSRPLEILRRPLRHAQITPLLVSPEQGPSSAPGTWEAGHEDAPVLDGVEQLVGVDSPLSGKALHEVREALLKPTHVRAAALDRVRRRVASTSGSGAADFLELHIDQAAARTGSSDLLTLMDLADMATGTQKAQQ